jgi:hypothetical protein
MLNLPFSLPKKLLYWDWFAVSGYIRADPRLNNVRRGRMALA